MANLTPVERLKIETILRMSSGYVLDFTNQSFHEFIKSTVGLDIYSAKYSLNGESKGK